MDRLLIPACLVLLVAGTACSIKEDRGPCPCYLQVSFTDPDAAGEAELLGWRDDRLFRDRIRIEEARPAWTKPVPKGMLTVSACTGYREAFAEGRHMRIPPGFEADSLYAWAGEVDATGDMAHASVTFRKQFATVFLDIRKSAGKLLRVRPPGLLVRRGEVPVHSDSPRGREHRHLPCPPTGRQPPRGDDPSGRGWRQPLPAGRIHRPARIQLENRRTARHLCRHRPGPRPGRCPGRGLGGRDDLPADRTINRES